MFATSIGDFFLDFLLVGGCLLFFAVKILGTLDEDGAIKQKANEGLAAWITRWLK